MSAREGQGNWRPLWFSLMAFSVQIPSLGLHIVYMGQEHVLPTPCSVMRYWRGCYVSQGTVFSAALRGSQGLPSLCHFYEMIKLGKWKGKKNGSRSVCWAQGMSLKAGKREGGRTCRQWGERREGYTQRKPARSGPFSDATACFIHSKTVIHGHP